jgi:hypothetical protein
MRSAANEQYTYEDGDDVSSHLTQRSDGPVLSRRNPPRNCRTHGAGAAVPVGWNAELAGTGLGRGHVFHHAGFRDEVTESLRSRVVRSDDESDQAKE